MKFFKHNWNKIINYLPIIVVFSMMLVMAVPVYAAYNYYAPISITNNSTNNYGDIPVLVSMNNTQLASLDYILATGLDTDVQGTTSIPYSLSATRLGVFEEFNAYDSRDLAYYLGYTPNQTEYPLIVGVGGYITTDDDASLEPGADFTIDYSGYVDTSAANVGETIAKKDGAASLYVSSAGNIAGGILTPSIIPMIPSANVAPGVTGSWQDVDCTALGVPDTASGVVVHYVNTSGATTYDVGLRKNGSADDRHGDMRHNTHDWAMIGTDANGIFEAYIENAAIDMYIVGYTNPGTVIFNTNGVDVSLGVTAAWTDIDCSAICPDAKAIIVNIYNSGVGSFAAGLRPNGSASVVNYGTGIAHSSQFYLVGCDANQIIEGQIASTTYDFYVIGYITDGIVMFTDPVDKSLGGTGAYTDIDCSASAPDASGLIFSMTNTSTSCALRKNGSAEDLYYDTSYTCIPMAIIECDTSQIVEGKIEAVATDFWLWGYFGFYDTDIISVTGACASGEHDIRLDYNGANLDLFIDNMGVAVDTEAIVTTVPDNANDWIIGSNATPYIDSITFDIGGATALWYEPVTIILADTATDRSGSGNHGDITWGANPAGIEITILGLVSSETFTASGDDGSIPDPLPIPSAFNITATNTTGITTFWMYDLVNRAAEHLGFSAQTMYVLIGLIAATGVGFGALIGTGNMLGFAIGFGTTAGLFAASGVMPWWIIIIIVSIAAMGIYTWKRG